MYDFIIVGGGYGGLVSAAYLSKYGYKVAVLEKHATLGGCAGYFSRKGFKFEVGATTLNGLGPGGVLEKIVRGVQIDLRFARQDPAIVCRYGNDSIRRYADPVRWAMELSKVCKDVELTKFCSMIEAKSSKLWKIASSAPIPPKNLASVATVMKNGVLNASSALRGSLVPFDSLLPTSFRYNKDFVNVINELLLISITGIHGRYSDKHWYFGARVSIRYVLPGGWN
ncbi:FAD-dependent oxidoreductase [Puniceicoccaceae bacterium K14]|nr:FAD-dependent oxidoreductase [Puniceicoccaceae bacterium K14]